MLCNKSKMGEGGVPHTEPLEKGGEGLVRLLNFNHELVLNMVQLMNKNENNNAKRIREDNNGKSPVPEKVEGAFKRPFPVRSDGRAVGGGVISPMKKARVETQEEEEREELPRKCANLITQVQELQSQVKTQKEVILTLQRNIAILNKENSRKNNLSTGYTKTMVTYLKDPHELDSMIEDVVHLQSTFTQLIDNICNHNDDEHGRDEEDPELVEFRTEVEHLFTQARRKLGRWQRNQREMYDELQMTKQLLLNSLAQVMFQKSKRQIQEQTSSCSSPQNIPNLENINDLHIKPATSVSTSMPPPTSTVSKSGTYQNHFPQWPTASHHRSYHAKSIPIQGFPFRIPTRTHEKLKIPISVSVSYTSTSTSASESRRLHNYHRFVQPQPHPSVIRSSENGRPPGISNFSYATTPQDHNIGNNQVSSGSPSVLSAASQSQSLSQDEKRNMARNRSQSLPQDQNFNMSPNRSQSLFQGQQFTNAPITSQSLSQGQKFNIAPDTCQSQSPSQNQNINKDLNQEAPSAPPESKQSDQQMSPKAVNAGEMDASLQPAAYSMPGPESTTAEVDSGAAVDKVFMCDTCATCFATIVQLRLHIKVVH